MNENENKSYDYFEEMKKITVSHASELVAENTGNFMMQLLSQNLKEAFTPNTARITLKRLKDTIETFECMFQDLKCDVAQFENALQERGIL